jgi:signal peptidase I
LEEEEVKTPQQRAKNEVWEWFKALAIAATLVFLIRTFIFAPFIVDGHSMEPNFFSSERLIVNKLIYSIREPHRGEVVVFHATAGKDYIKRVIALPGETVKVANNKVYVNGKELEEPYLESTVTEKAKLGEIYNRPEQPEIIVPEGKIFVMGDNRPNSTDSRFIGPVDDSQIVGRADLVFWPFNKFEFVKH